MGIKKVMEVDNYRKSVNYDDGKHIGHGHN